jgi:hypothetical protein
MTVQALVETFPWEETDAQWFLAYPGIQVDPDVSPV